MLVKVIVSAAGADFSVNYGQEIEFSELKALIGNGAENFCVPVDGRVKWPPVAEKAVDPEPVAEVVVVEPVVESPAAEPAAETRKGRRK